MQDTDIALERLRRDHDDHAAEKTGDRAAKPALCLSGGGYRAALFHLGALLRLWQIGLLARLALISAVSGGSIVAGWLMCRYLDGRRADESFDGWAARVDFREDVVERFREVTDRDLRTAPVLKTFVYNWLAPSRRVALLERAYREIYGDHLLTELPATPRVVFCATNLTFGVNWEFSAERVGDYLSGYLEGGGDFTLARAVAASSSFPPVFGPMVLRLAPGSFRHGRYEGPDGAKLRARIELSDGGVYDNLAMEPALRRYDQVLISDAGAPFPFHASRQYVRRLLRYTQVIGNQAGALRRRLFFASRHHGVFSGGLWSLPGEPSPGSPGFSSRFVQDHIARIRTDLDPFTEDEFRTLVNHGYFSCENGLDHAGQLPADAPAPDWPFPDHADEASLKRRLKASHRRVLHLRWIGWR